MVVFNDLMNKDYVLMGVVDSFIDLTIGYRLVLTTDLGVVISATEKEHHLEHAANFARVIRSYVNLVLLAGIITRIVNVHEDLTRIARSITD